MPFAPGVRTNPGGMTREARAYRDLMRAALCTPEMMKAWKTAYLNQIIAENPFVLRDYADRIGGKPKETVEFIDGDESQAQTRLTIEELKANARFQLEKERTRMLEATNNDNH